MKDISGGKTGEVARFMSEEGVWMVLGKDERGVNRLDVD